MPSTVADRELQARLLKEIHALNERRLKLESDIRALDVARNLHMEKGALRDIDAYKHLDRLRRSNADQIRKLSNRHEQ
jgi:hypothetical protein